MRIFRKFALILMALILIQGSLLSDLYSETQQTEEQPKKIIPATAPGKEHKQNQLKPKASPPKGIPQKPLVLVELPDSLQPEFVDYDLLSKKYFQNIERLNLKGVELRDIFRGIAYQYDVNLLIDNSLAQPVTLTLTNIKVIDCIKLLCVENNLLVSQDGDVLRIGPQPEIEEPEPDLDIKYVRNKLTIDIDNADVGKVVRKISTLTETNIILEQSAQGRISGFIKSVAVEKGIKILFETNGFDVRQKDDIYYIYLSEFDKEGKRKSRKRIWMTESDGLLSFELENVDIENVIQEIIQQVDINLITYGTPKGKITAKCSGLSLDETLNYLFQSTDYSFKVENGIYIIGEKNSTGLVTSKLIRLNHISSEGIESLLPDLIRKHTTIKQIKEQNALLVIGTSDLIFKTETFLSQIDHPTPQILIEALVVDINTSDLRELGVLLGSNDVSSGTTPWQNYSLLDMGFNGEGSYYAQYDKDALNNGLNTLSDWMGVAAFGKLPGDFYLKVQALENEGLAFVRSRPQIATLNGHPASIVVGTTQYYLLKTVTPVTSNDEIVTQETERFERIEANVTLSIVPWVSASGEVTVEIHPEFQTPVGSFNAETPPTINSRILDSTVRLRDGETIIMGGLIQESDTKNEYKVPILGDIPLLGYLFRGKSKNKSKTELMIYITPHIFYGDELDNSKWQQLREKREQVIEK